MSKFRTFLPFALLLVLPLVSCAAPAATLSNPSPGGGATLQDFIALLIKIIQAVGIPALVVAIIYSGYILLTAGGNEVQITKGKVWIFWTLIGAAIVMGAQVIADAVFATAALF
jgi:small-conductance mechanosensitive channel